MFKKNCFLLIFLFLSISVFSQNKDLSNDLRTKFSNFKIIQVNKNEVMQKLNQRQTILFDNFEISLIPRDLRSLRYRAEETNQNGLKQLEKNPVSTYKGKVKNEANSQVRLTINNDKIEGYINSNNQFFYVESAKNFSKSANENDVVIYQAKDLIHQETFYCPTDLAKKIEHGKNFLSEQVTTNLPTVRVLEIATEADSDFVSNFGSSAATNVEILSVLNLVEGVYEQELGLTIEVVYQHTWSGSDPYPNSGASGILTAFKNHWNANFTGISRDIAHLWTAKSSSLNQGIAYLGVVCNDPANSYSLTGKIEGIPTQLMSGHEIAHNLGADHAGTFQITPNQPCDTTAMNPLLSNITPLTFCDFSRGQVNNHITINNSCLSVRNLVPTKFDFDGDNKADISVWRPSNGGWYINKSSDNGFFAVSFGQSGDKIVPADYDGDGKTDAAVFRSGTWYRLKSTDFTFDGIPFGNATDIPAPADFDGDGKADVNVFRGTDGNWYRLNSGNGAFSATPFGLNGDVPTPNDYDGDGKADVSVFRPSNGAWYRLNSNNSSFFAVSFGQNGDKAVPADFTGDGKTDIAVFRAGFWYILRSEDLTFYGVPFGNATDIPAPADFDGDGKADVTVYRDGQWFISTSSNSGFLAFPFGLSGDIPTPSN
ncbi:MAG: FG-GAP-like repeat-containing protein [Pyrinomonadaceae bacterium]|nr:FG-GAP-like repeat-containing protein [Pyrinomonadaceae bacterium]